MDKKAGPVVAAHATWGSEQGPFKALARNVSTRYLAYAVDAGLGLLMLPFNLDYLGKSEYGLWILTASVTTSFALLDLGYGGTLVRFVARYRGLRDSKALNEILSTLFVVYVAIGAATVGAALLIAPHLGSLFRIPPDQIVVAQRVLLMLSIYAGARFAFSVYGGVIVGFQQYHLNNAVSIFMSLVVAAVNVAVLLAGFGLVALVAATTSVRILCLWLYRRNAHKVYPALRIRVTEFKRERLKEATGFSAYMLLLDIGNKLNYGADTLVIGAFLGPAAVALWAPAQRLTHVLARLTTQINDGLFPVVVDSDAAQRNDRLRGAFVQGTRLSLALAVPMAGSVALLAYPLIEAWLGPTFGTTAAVLQVLAVLVIFRVGNGAASIIMLGAGEHERLTAYVGVTGIANLALSALLIGPLGLSGVALGSLAPIAVLWVAASFPRACRRVGLTYWEGFTSSIWPSVWPVAVVAAWLWASSLIASPGVLPLLLRVGAGIALYAVVFFTLALNEAERRRYAAKLRELLPRQARVSPALQ